MNYEILEVRINFSIHRKVMINVAIESSPGRFKAYQLESNVDRIDIDEIEQACKYGKKLSEKDAKYLFNRINRKYEG